MIWPLKILDCYNNAWQHAAAGQCSRKSTESQGFWLRCRKERLSWSIRGSTSDPAAVVAGGKVTSVSMVWLWGGTIFIHSHSFCALEEGSWVCATTALKTCISILHQSQNALSVLCTEYTITPPRTWKTSMTAHWSTIPEVSLHLPVRP